jgi:MFS family permease
VKKSGVVIRRCAPFTRSLADWVWPSTSNELLLDPPENGGVVVVAALTLLVSGCGLFSTNGPDKAVAAFLTAWSAGAILGALAARRLNEQTERGAILLGVAAVAVGYVLIAVSPVYAMVFVLQAATAFCDSRGGIAGNSFIQRRTPDEVRARVFAAVTSMWLMANVIAFPLAGVVLGLWGPRAVYILGAAVAVVSTLMLLPVMRTSAPEAPASD